MPSPSAEIVASPSSLPRSRGLPRPVSRVQVFSFGDVEVHPDARRVLVAGRPAKLGARAFDILLTLIEHRDRVVTKGELLDRVWAGVVVEENNLQVHISALRKALGPHALATIPGRGYRFTAPLDSSDATAAVSAPGATPASAVETAATIAVLPFADIGGDTDCSPFADGLAEDLIIDLSRWRTLTVASRNSTARFKGQAIDLREIGRELDVRFIVDGSVRWMGERVRVAAQLIDAETGNQVWGDRFDRPADDLYTVQDELVRTIVSTLVGRVHATDADRARRKAPSSLDAYDYVLRGNALSWDDPVSAAEARQAFERAIRIDPGYGLPESLLAVLLARDWENGRAGTEALERAFDLAERAVAHSDDESTCHTILGQIALERRLFDFALHHTERGVEINPRNPWNRADLGALYAYVGRAEEGLGLLREARGADPYFSPRWYWRSLGVAQFVLRRYADALQDLEPGATDSSLRALAIMAGCCAQLGLAERAREIVDRCLAAQPQASVSLLVDRTPFRDAGDRLHLAACLRLAGLPE